MSRWLGETTDASNEDRRHGPEQINGARHTEVPAPRGPAVLSADEVKALLSLRPLPEEGGFFARTYLGAPLPCDALMGRYRGERPIATAIYYLLTRDEVSALHRLPGDELFHFYLGDAVEQLRLFPDGSGRVVTIGPDLAAGERPQALVPGGVWQGARLSAGGRHGYALLGTTMSPGFSFADYEAGARDALVAAYPASRGWIEALTPSSASG